MLQDGSGSVSFILHHSPVKAWHMCGALLNWFRVGHSLHLAILYLAGVITMNLAGDITMKGASQWLLGRVRHVLGAVLLQLTRRMRSLGVSQHAYTHAIPCPVIACRPPLFQFASPGGFQLFKLFFIELKLRIGPIAFDPAGSRDTSLGAKKLVTIAVPSSLASWDVVGMRTLSPKP